MNISLKVESVAEVQKALAGIGKTQSKKAVRLWANWCGLEMQGEMRRQIPQRFNFRGTAEGFKQAIVFSRAQTKGDRELSAHLTVGGPGTFSKSRTQKLGMILARHESGETRVETNQTFYNGRGQAMTGLGFFLPAKGLRTATQNPPRQMYPVNIGAALRLTPESTPILAKGTKKGSKAKGTGVSFFATRQGIFRRKHTRFGGRVEVEAIWWFRRTIRTPARLKLWETAEKVFAARSVALGMQAIEETLFRETL